MRAGCILAAAAVILILPGLTYALDEPYAWALSASDTDPFVHTAPPLPEPGSFDVWLWLTCHEADGIAAAEFDIVPSGNFAIAAFVPETPSVINFGGSLGDLVLAFAACPVPPFRAGRLIVIDLGGGGSLCIGPSAANGVNVSVDCAFPQPREFPNGVLGFSSDGSQPCVLGDCLDTAVSSGEPGVEHSTWGRVKGIYR